MKIFVTGSTGFIGSSLVNYFCSHEVVVYHRNLVDIKTQLHLSKPDWIINCAAEIYNANLMWAANVELVKDCLDWIKLNPSTKMIHLGSSSEYGTYNRSTKESDAMNATDMYGTTKGIATQLCRTYAKTYNLDIVVLRPYSPYGPGESSRRLFPTLWRAFNSNQPMELVQGVHDFCYIDDFVQAVDKVMQSNKRTLGDIINVSSGIQSTNIEVLNCFRKVTGKEGAVTIVDKFCTPKVWQANITYVTKHYGWRPTTSLESGIKQFLEKANYE